MKDFQNTGKMAHCDALGKEVIIGKRYGWARNDNGLTQVTIGIAEKFTEKGVTLKIESAKKGLYEYDPEPLPIGGTEYNAVKEKVNVKGMILFPIPDPERKVLKDTFDHKNSNGFSHMDEY